MKAGMNDNEVKEVAKMQMKIDTYESFICTVCAMIVTRTTDLNYLLFDGTELTDKMQKIWCFTKEKLEADESKKSSEAAKAVPQKHGV